MKTAQTSLRNNQKSMTTSERSKPNTIMPMSSSAINSNKFWGIWLPVPTFLAIVNSLFWTWLILRTVGYSEAPIEKAGEWIIEEF